MKLNTPALTPEAFVARWQNTTLGERQSYQQHFIDVCRLVGAQTPGEMDQAGDNYLFEYGLKKTSGRQGYADVFYRGFFAIEYKGRGKYDDLNQAYVQLQQYRENLNNPPLLIVCDIENWEIHTNFTNTPTTLIKFKHEDLLKPTYRNTLRRMFSDPGSFHPEKNKLQITEDVAAKFKAVVDDAISEWKHDPDRLARFMTKLVFCMFVEDIGLLPKRAYDGVFTEIVMETRFHPDFKAMFPRYLRELFDAMATGGNVQMVDIPYFNGSMFTVGESDIVPLGREALNALYQASGRDWSHVEPTVFGTIFERTLDEKKRGQLGAHYTHPDDITLIVKPVLMQPLRREWAAAQTAAAPIRERYLNASNAAQKMSAEIELKAVRTAILERIRSIKVLDPACGSGNFLYISLQMLLDLEKEVITSPLWAGLPRETIRVRPTQLYGMEINEIAHALASVVVWIGYLQWKQENGYFEIREPILDKMDGNIRHMDAILSYDANGKPTEPDWAAVDVIVGNPPFLGGRRMRFELESKYVDDLRKVYAGRVSGSADLVTYWFERARKQLEKGLAKRIGLLATNSIRDGANRKVLERIKNTGDIFMAWSDREWTLEGAALNVSMIGFDDGSETEKTLDGAAVSAINPDLTTNTNVANASHLSENETLCFLGVMKAGPFDVDSAKAQQMVSAVNASGKSNSEVVKKRLNGEDITGRYSNTWIIDFGIDRTEADAATYELPFEYVVKYVKPARSESRNTALKAKWWLHGRPRPALRAAISSFKRCIVTPEVAKHRLFIWMNTETVPDHTLHVIARDDDYFFGVLHSRLHEVWSLHMGSTLEDRPRYTSTNTFETFPFPFVPGKEDFTDARVIAIGAAAKALHEARHAWLNPPEGTPRLQDRTLTNLYNALQAHRGTGTTKGIKAAAAEFAPRLAALHDALDQAVIAAYGWDKSLLGDEEGLLRNLLALNGVRAK